MEFKSIEDMQAHYKRIRERMATVPRRPDPANVGRITNATEAEAVRLEPVRRLIESTTTAARARPHTLSGNKALQIYLTKFRREHKRLSRTDCAKKICADYGLGLTDLRGYSEGQYLVYARWHAAWLMFCHGHSLKQIGEYMHRDHSSIIYGVQKLVAVYREEISACEE